MPNLLLLLLGRLVEATLAVHGSKRTNASQPLMFAIQNDGTQQLLLLMMMMISRSILITTTPTIVIALIFGSRRRRRFSSR